MAGRIAEILSSARPWSPAAAGRRAAEGGESRVRVPPPPGAAAPIVRVASIPAGPAARPGAAPFVVHLSTPQREWEVERQYGDFDRVHRRLCAACPLTAPYHSAEGAVPPLPAPSWEPEVLGDLLEAWLQQLLIPANRRLWARDDVRGLLGLLHSDVGGDDAGLPAAAARVAAATQTAPPPPGSPAAKAPPSALTPCARAPSTRPASPRPVPAPHPKSQPRDGGGGWCRCGGGERQRPPTTAPPRRQHSRQHPARRAPAGSINVTAVAAP